jgi:hypothetical protein
MRARNVVLASTLLMAAALPLAAQPLHPAAPDTLRRDTASTAAAGVERSQHITVQHYRPVDARGLNVFEAPKDDSTPYTGFKLMFGAAFTQQFQDIHHRNDATPRMVSGVDQNALVEIGPGFNNAVANLYVNAQLAPGIRVQMTSYLSSRHHSETWVKDGFILIDQSPFDVPILNRIMKYTTLRVGEMELNYGDSHFRRTDNGNAIYNPFVGNLLMDPFTTEAGAEAYVRASGFLGMVGVTAGQLHPSVTDPRHRTPSYLAKLGYDRQVTPDLRMRLTGSMYTNPHSSEQNLYTGDRAGSRYYFVMENATATENSSLRSAMLSPGMTYKLTSMVLNPFVKLNGLELFGQLERAHGRAATETADRTWSQKAIDLTYRFLPGQPLYVAARYNTVRGPLAGTTNDVGADRWQLSSGLYVTSNILLKGEYVTQKYTGYDPTNILSGGRFHGFVVEGTVAF